MSVDEWARREAANVVPIFSSEADMAVLIATRLASALLSDDKAARAAVRQLIEFGCNSPAKFRAALQAAVDAVTKGEGE